MKPVMTDYIFGAIPGAINTAYNLYTNKRDFDYQKALQQKMFEREDTAVQRRMADLQAAGLNPNLAAGSAAGAGSVVSRSSTNDVNMGSALDTLQAVNNIKMQKQQNYNASVEGQILNYKRDQEERTNSLDFLLTLKSLGFNPDVYLNRDGTLSFGYEQGKPTKNNLLFDELDYQNQNLKNSADLLQKELDWYTAETLTKIITSGLGSLTGLTNAGANVSRTGTLIKKLNRR